MSNEKKRDDYAVEMQNLGRSGKGFDQPLSSPRPSGPAPITSATNNPILPILSYCGSSILMTVTNKYVLSGFGFNLNSFLLCVQVCESPVDMRFDTDRMQSVVCVVAIQLCKSSGIITYRDFNSDEARKCRSYLWQMAISLLTSSQGFRSPSCSSALFTQAPKLFNSCLYRCIQFSRI